MCKNIVESNKPRITVWHMSFACLVHDAADKHSEYVILRMRGAASVRIKLKVPATQRHHRKRAARARWLVITKVRFLYGLPTCCLSMATVVTSALLNAKFVLTLPLRFSWLVS